MRVALIGHGYWGQNLARNIADTPGMKLCYIADPDSDNRALAARRYPNASAVPADSQNLDLTLADVDAVCIATPVRTHEELVRSALAAGKHVLVTKPLAHSLEAAESLRDLAAQKGLILLVDHTFVYTGAVRELREWCDKVDGLGDWLYFDSVRVNLGAFRDDADVLWDLAAHDLSILMHLTSRFPTHIQCVGADPTRTGKTSVAHLTVWLEDDILAHIHVSWLSPVKVRRTLIGGARRMAIYDDVEPSEKVKIYDSGAENVDGRIEYRTGSCLIPKLDIREALAVELRDFATCIIGGVAPVSGGPEGVAVVCLLEAASQSLAAGGIKVETC